MTIFIGLQETGALRADAATIDEILAAGRGSFTTNGPCPKCKSKSNDLQVMPILEAEQKGIVKFDHNVIREKFHADDTQFVICPKCGWQGIPTRQEMTTYSKSH